MKKLFKLVLGVTLLMGAPAFAVVMQYLDANNQPVNVSGAEPMPVNAEVTVGSITASLSGDVNIIGQTVSSLTVHVDNPQTSVSVSNMPTTIGVSGLASTTQAGATSFAHSQITAANSQQYLTTSSACESLAFFSQASTTVWFSLDGIGATVSYSIPLTGTGTAQAQQSFSIGPNKRVYYTASTTAPFLAVESGR